MNCPVCGAENDVDTRFCAECGAQLENQDESDDTIAGQIFYDSDDDDATILSSRDEIAAQMRASVADDAPNRVEDEASDYSGPPDTILSPAESEISPSPSRGSLTNILSDEPGTEKDSDAGLSSDNQDGNENSKRTLYIIVGGVAGLLLLCCCCSLVIGGVIGSDPGMIEDILGSVGRSDLELSNQEIVPFLERGIMYIGQ